MTDIDAAIRKELNASAAALPTGGSTGQVLTKNSNANSDAGWKTVNALPAGGATGQVLTKNSGTDGDAGWAATAYVYSVTFSQPGVLATGTGTLRWLCGWTSATIHGSVMAVGTAPTGASIICDVKKNGSTIYSTSGNRPTIAVSTNATSSLPTPNTTTIASGDYLTVDIAQVGSTIAGADLVIQVLLTNLVI